jgi:hypothetical protein
MLLQSLPRYISACILARVYASPEDIVTVCPIPYPRTYHAPYAIVQQARGFDINMLWAEIEDAQIVHCNVLSTMQIGITAMSAGRRSGQHRLDYAGR